MSISPKISIITVCFNSEKHIEECIKSVVGQSYANKEYIIIDGGSSDKTIQIIDKYKGHIDYFISESDNGISDAFNKGIKAATGDLIGILNSDDFMMEEALQKVADNYEPGISIFRGHCMIYNEELDTKYKMFPNNKFGLIPFKARVCHESSYISREAYDKFGLYKTDLKHMMDLDLFIRMYNGGISSKFIDVSVITFRTGGASSVPEKYIKNERKRIILENGGNKFQAFIYVTFFRLRYLFKNILDLIAKDIKYRLKYSKSDN